MWMIGEKCRGSRKTWRECVNDDVKCLVGSLNGQYPGICGGTSYGANV